MASTLFIGIAVTGLFLVAMTIGSDELLIFAAVIFWVGITDSFINVPMYDFVVKAISFVFILGLSLLMLAWIAQSEQESTTTSTQASQPESNSSETGRKMSSSSVKSKLNDARESLEKE